MSISDQTAKSQHSTLRFEFSLDHKPGKVWRALTEPELLEQWLLPMVGSIADVGARFTFVTDPQPGWDGIVHCRLLSMSPGREISYAWVVGEMDTVVTFTLEPTESGTRLVLVHSGFQPHQKKNFGGARYGWRMMGTRLIELLTGIT